MSDLAFELLREKMQKHHGKGLWVVDENLPQNIATLAQAEIHCITNRCDVAAELQRREFSVQLNDFDLSIFDSQSFDVVYYRVSKEKPVVHRIINQLGRYLKPGGRLYLSGFKGEGAKTYIAKAGRFLGSLEEKILGGKTSMIATIVCDGEFSRDESKDDDSRAMLDDKQYGELRDINADNEIVFSSKPGVYGWQKEDRGSAFLIENLPPLLARINADIGIQSVADLGCGYGYLSVKAAQFMDATFYASDNNVAAVRCCQENFRRHGVNGEVSLDSCGAKMPSGMDFVLCNPPFHQGFDVESDLTTRFIEAASRVLNKGAYAFFVVNAFIPLEKKAARYFDKVETIANNKSFKLLLLKK